jgi:hypothetical protein
MLIFDQISIEWEIMISIRRAKDVGIVENGFFESLTMAVGLFADFVQGNELN